MLVSNLSLKLIAAPRQQRKQNLKVQPQSIHQRRDASAGNQSQQQRRARHLVVLHKLTEQLSDQLKVASDANAQQRSRPPRCRVRAPSPRAAVVKPFASATAITSPRTCCAVMPPSRLQTSLCCKDRGRQLWRQMPAAMAVQRVWRAPDLSANTRRADAHQADFELVPLLAPADPTRLAPHALPFQRGNVPRSALSAADIGLMLYTL